MKFHIVHYSIGLVLGCFIWVGINSVVGCNITKKPISENAKDSVLIPYKSNLYIANGDKLDTFNFYVAKGDAVGGVLYVTPPIDSTFEYIRLRDEAMDSISKRIFENKDSFNKLYALYGSKLKSRRAKHTEMLSMHTEMMKLNRELCGMVLSLDSINVVYRNKILHQKSKKR